ncbi:MAG: hypothetical protein SCALA702_00590 [Melioribacteraceae bacterium]|nr:MAG: hypothetical protein SCALA702_00590 [Melioribacteraceae bacterium]
MPALFVSSILTLIVFIVISAIISSVFNKDKKPLTEKYHTFWPRFWSPFIDGMILYPITIIVSIIYLNVELTVIVYLLLSLIDHTAVYIYTIYYHGKYGHTIGKKVCNLKVVDNQTEAPISYMQALKREIVPIILLVIALFSLSLNFESYFALIDPTKMNELQTGPMMVWTMVVGGVFLFWFLAEVLTMLTNDKRRALHDMIAGTVVVRTNLIGETEEPKLETV